MKTETVTRQLAASVETAEAHAWLDMYEAAPADYAREYRLEVKRIGGVTIFTCGAIPFPHFNSVMGLGLTEPATEKLVDNILEMFGDIGINNFYIHHLPDSQPQELTQWLETKNLRVKSGWDRIYKQGPDSPPSWPPETDGPKVERVRPETAAEWADYISDIYGLPTAPWLKSLVWRPGWHHYILRQGRAIAAARSMYLHHDGTAWLGIDAPVPGIMAPSYELDYRICQAALSDGITLGAKCFVADIEAPSPQMDTPAYRNFESLGFRRLYLRSNYGR
jgi:hypothetical protein